MSDWYYSDSKRHTGPVSKETIISLVSSGTLGAFHVVWRIGFSDWVQIQNTEFVDFIPEKHQYWRRASTPVNIKPLAWLNLQRCDIELVGLLCITCPCGQKYVINSTQINDGAFFDCSCGRKLTINSGSVLQWQIIQDNNCISNPPRGSEMMPLDMYKSKVAEWVVTGKKPKVPAKHKQTVTFDSKGVNIDLLAKSLTTTLGIDNKETVRLIKEAVELDILSEEDIVKYILTKL